MWNSSPFRFRKEFCTFEGQSPWTLAYKRLVDFVSSLSNPLGILFADPLLTDTQWVGTVCSGVEYFGHFYLGLSGSWC